jgi:hypothetical protein
MEVQLTKLARRIALDEAGSATVGHSDGDAR